METAVKPLLQTRALPRPPHRLIGREKELAEAQAVLGSRSSRLLTLTGPGGVGKTRLAIESAAESEGAFADGACFVDLTALAAPDLVPSAILQACGFRTTGALPPQDTLVGQLEEAELLLVLDNFEHLLDATPFLASLLTACPGVSLLVTSRERLRVAAERVMQVEPLPVPDLSSDAAQSGLAGVPSIQLFAERAQSTSPDFDLTPSVLEPVARICARLDGLPLALELAASQVAFLAPQDIFKRLDARMSNLRAAMRDAPPRHETLRATIAWSYELLSQSERALFRRLAVFAGGWTLDAAEAVLPSDGDLDIIEALGALTEKNLVRVVRRTDGSLRYTMLETIHAFAFSELESCGESGEMRRRHADYIVALLERAADESMGPAWFDRIEPELENMRAVLSWALSIGDPDRLALRVATAPFLFYWQRGHAAEGRRWMTEVLRIHGDGLGAAERLRVLESLGTLTGWQKEYDAGVAMLNEARTLADDLEDDEARTRIIARTGWIAWVNGRHELLDELYERLRTTAPSVGTWTRADALLAIGHVLFDAARFEDAEAALEESISLFAEAGGEDHGVTHALTKLALIRLEKDDFEGALERTRAALARARELNDLHVTAFAADDIVQLVGMQASPAAVARLLGAGDALRARVTWERTPREQFTRRVQVRARVQERLTPEALARAEAEGASLSISEILDLAEMLVDAVDPVARAARGDDTSGLLSSREAEVLALLSAGLSNRDIGERLVLSVRTVEKHVANVYAKIGARGRADAAAFAVRNGIVPSE